MDVVKKTLDRVLSRSGAGSRTEVRGWIRAGRVRVNGQVVRDPETWVIPETDRVSLDGTPLRSATRVYLALYKPKGVITTRHDKAGRKTVFDLLPDRDRYVFPIGRLDVDTSGLLLLTNDSTFAERLMNPAFHVPKTYLVKAAPPLDDAALDRLRAGIELEDGPTRPATVSRTRDSASATFLEITITEGRNRQVRRMIEAIGGHVLKLVRIRIGPLRLGALTPGACRALTPDEIRSLQKAGGLDAG